MGSIALRGFGKAFRKSTRGTPYKVEKAPADRGQGRRVRKARERGEVAIKRTRGDGTTYTDYVQQNKEREFTYKSKYPRGAKQGRLFGEKFYKGRKEEQLKLPFSETARKKLGIQQRKTERAEKKRLKTETAKNLKIMKESKKFEKKKLKRTFVGLQNQKKKLKGKE